MGAFQLKSEAGEGRRADFPILADPSLIYLDSAASAQKPGVVIEAMSDFCKESYANVHRGVYRLSETATALYDQVREKVKTFIGARSSKEVIFTSGTTAGINLLAYSWGRKNLKEGDEILTTIFEHHSNFVPWQILAKETGAVIRYVPLNAAGGFSKEDFVRFLSPKTKLASFTYIANGLGIMLPVKELATLAHRVGAVVHVDGAQAVPHLFVNMVDLDVDFFTFSAHKMYGPTGVGVFYGKEHLLENMPPFLSGGDMIRSVSLGGTTFNDLPLKFEAGTPNIIGVIGLGAAVEYLTSLGIDEVNRYESGLVKLLESELEKIPEVTVLGPKNDHHALVCFVTKDIHPHDVAQFLDQQGIAVRAGHHCAQTLLEHLSIQASTRASIGVYNSEKDIYALSEALKKAVTYFKR